MLWWKRVGRPKFEVTLWLFTSSIIWDHKDSYTSLTSAYFLDPQKKHFNVHLLYLNINNLWSAQAFSSKCKLLHVFCVQLINQTVQFMTDLSTSRFYNFQTSSFQHKMLILYISLRTVMNIRINIIWSINNRKTCFNNINTNINLTFEFLLFLNIF